MQVRILFVKVICRLTSSIQAGLYTPNCLPLQIFVKPVADRTRMASAIAVVSVTLCICVLHPRNSYLRYGTANALSVGSTHPKIKPEVVVGSHLSAKVGKDEVPVRGVGVVTGKTGGRESRVDAYLQSPTLPLVLRRSDQTKSRTLNVSCGFFYNQ
jgi:hypothetical protein